VLWAVPAIPGFVMYPDGGWETAQACRNEMEKRTKVQNERTGGPNALFRCLPDTVDPRGPKGK
jgi:hypothetical protein